MASGSEIFETYEKEYATIHDSITRKVGGLISASPDQKKLLVSQAQRELEEADEIISQMEMELLSLPSNTKTLLTPKVKAYKDEIKKAKRDLAKNGLSERDQLLGGSAAHSRSASNQNHVVDFEAANQDQRGRLINGTERLQEGSKRLEEAKRVAYEAESMGISTLNDLNNQREQINRTRNTLQNADSWVTKSQGVLRGMFKQLSSLPLSSLKAQEFL
ncbi:hypothetical protein HDU97_006815 [Phlyctochytrium planicorne]|nr:hypothetical protein HDU97_006815 [Phlyctochytrium planicorne]